MPRSIRVVGFTRHNSRVAVALADSAMIFKFRVGVCLHFLQWFNMYPCVWLCCCLPLLHVRRVDIAVEQLCEILFIDGRSAFSILYILHDWS